MARARTERREKARERRYDLRDTGDGRVSGDAVRVDMRLARDGRRCRAQCRYEHGSGDLDVDRE